MTQREIPSSTPERLVADACAADIEDAFATSLEVNGMSRTWSGMPDRMLLDVLRQEFALTGAKAGCERGECGACTVLVGGRPTLSCMLPAILVGAPVETIEGLAAEARPLREAFADLGGFQCGFCTPGQIVSGWAIVREGVSATDAEAMVRRRMSGNICRCTGYVGIVDAILRVAARHGGHR